MEQGPDTRTVRLNAIAYGLEGEGLYTSANSLRAIVEERDKLLERCESYKTQVKAGAKEIERLVAERDKLSEVFFGEPYSRDTQTGETLLAKRHKTHGDFADTAHIAQLLKGIMSDNGAYKLNEVKIECLSGIATKIARILSGDHNHKDHWDDIAGYARLAVS